MNDQIVTKKCPDCAEDVRVEARKCRFCGHELQEQRPDWNAIRASLAAAPHDATKAEVSDGKRKSKKGWWIAGGAVVALFIVNNMLSKELEQSFKDEAGAAPHAPAPATAASSPNPIETSNGASKRIGLNLLEQSIFDAFPASPPKTKAERTAASNAADYVSFTINTAGHLCAQPIEAQQASDGIYGIRCRKYRKEGEWAIYLVDVRTGNVDDIS